MKSKLFAILLSLSLVFSVVPSPAAQARSWQPVQDVVVAQTPLLGQAGLSFRYAQNFGLSSEPYLADTGHLNGPAGIFVDASNNLYITEERGDRLLRYNSLGTNTLVLGQAGIPWYDTTFLSAPREIAVNPANQRIWVLMDPALKEYNTSGTLRQIFPATNPQTPGTDNGRLGSQPLGMAFGAGGYLYVADTSNQRIQVFNVSSSTPAYITTIGTAGSAQSDNTGFNSPARLAFDSSNRLYVMDAGNARVQRCTSAAPWTTWTCSTFFGVSGVSGTDLTHLAFQAQGISIDSGNNVFLGDGGNRRVLKCDALGTCSLFAGTPNVSGTGNNQFAWVSDVALDSTGNVYVSDFDNFRVQKFNSAGTYQRSFGATGVPYLTDTARIFNPVGVAAATDGSLYIPEGLGFRLLKVNSAGARQWTVGQAGVPGSAANRFGSLSGGLKGSPAIDANGRIYVADDGNYRVQVFNSDGTFFATLGTGPGAGDTQFDCMGGLAINPLDGDIFVVDRCNQRVQVFTSALAYKATLGVTGAAGNDAAHFSSPWGVAVDGSGNIFVGDSDNQRVQKCSLTGGSSYSCITFVGETGVQGSDFGHFQQPEALAVDAAGRVYVVDAGNSRVQVYDAGGAYLTTIGGLWATDKGDMTAPKGIAVDASGNVYVSDGDNHRVQKFARYTPGWQQSNLNGFGEQANDGVFALGTFGGQLYAGTENIGSGAQIWRSSDGSTWDQVMSGGFGDPTNIGIDTLLEFNGRLFAGTENYYGLNLDQTNGGQLWSTPDGSTWSQVSMPGFDGATNYEILRLAVHGNKLYASTWADTVAHGVEMWRSSTGDSGDWVKLESGFGNLNSNDEAAVSFATFGSYLYAGTINSTNGGAVWRSVSGDAGTWKQVNISGFGASANAIISALASYNGYLYAATHRTGGLGLEVWRCQVCANNPDWERVVDNGFGSPDVRSTPALEVFDGRLYLMVGDDLNGIQVWSSTDGVTWNQVAAAGFGVRHNATSYYDSAMTVFGTKLYAGTLNAVQGGQIWQSGPVISGNAGAAGASLAFTDGGPKTVKADAAGLYSIQVSANWAGTVTPSKPGYTFTPPNRSYAGTPVIDNLGGQDFTGTSSFPDTVGVFRPLNGALYMKNQNTNGFADYVLTYGLPGDYPVVGDWDGNGTTTLGIYRDGTFYLRNANSNGFADLSFAFGAAGDQPVAGDWDGDGIDTIGIYRAGTFFLRNSNSSGAPDAIFSLGIAGDVGIAGDWNGDGTITTGVFRPSNGALYLKNANTSGFADLYLTYGLPGDKPVTGDWDGDGIDTIGIYRLDTFFLRNSNTNGFADLSVTLGLNGDMPIAGDWDGLP